MKQKFFKKPSLIVLVTYLFLVGSSVFAQVEEKSEQIKIGAVLTLSGFGERWGQGAKQGIDLALEQINATGGIKGSALEVVVEDFKQFDLDTARRATRQLIVGNDVKVVLSQFNQDSSAVNEVAARHSVVTLALGAGARDLTNGNPWLFRIWPSDETFVKATVAHVFDRLKKRKVAILVETSPYFQSLRTICQDNWQAKSGSRANVLQFPANTTDFKPYLEKLVDIGSEALFVFTSYKTEAEILHQAQGVGFQGPIIGVLNSDDPLLLETAGDAAEGLVFPRYRPATSEFSRLFEARYGQAPGIGADVGYDAINVLAKVMREYGTEPAQIQVGLYNINNFKGASGEISIDQNRNRQGREVEMMSIQSGFAVHVLNDTSSTKEKSREKASATAGNKKEGTKTLAKGKTKTTKVVAPKSKQVVNKGKSGKAGVSPKKSSGKSAKKPAKPNTASKVKSKSKTKPKSKSVLKTKSSQTSKPKSSTSKAVTGQKKKANLKSAKLS